MHRLRFDYLLFLNPDTKIIKADFKALISFLNQHSNIGIIGLQIVLEDGSLQPYSYGKKFNIFSKFSPSFGMIDWVSGGAMVVRKDLFERLGGFDEQFFMYFEDQDLCLRAKNLGFKIKLWDGVKVLHFGGVPAQGGSHGDRKLQLKLYKESRAKFIKKHYGLTYYMLFALLDRLWRVSRMLIWH